jgi:hypothetical protein
MPSSGPHKQHKAIPDSFDSLVEELRKTSLLPNIRDDAIDAMLGITQGSISYAAYTRQLNEFLRRSRQHRADNLQCVFTSSMDRLTFNFRPEPSLIVHRGVILCL